MQIPRLPVSGENLKKYILDTLRGILDYLKATRLVEGDGISIRETPSGVIVSATRKGTAPGGASGAAEYDPGIGITITGGTPGVPEKINANITGGTSISVTGGTNGNPLVISYTGGGGGGGGGGGLDAPIWGYTYGTSIGNATSEIGAQSSDYSGGTFDPPITGSTVPSDGWIYAYAEFWTTNTYETGEAEAHVVVNGGLFKVASLRSYALDYQDPTQRIGAGSGITIPVKAGSVVAFVVSRGNLGGRYGCVYYAIS